MSDARTAVASRRAARRVWWSILLGGCSLVWNTDRVDGGPSDAGADAFVGDAGALEASVDVGVDADLDAWVPIDVGTDADLDAAVAVEDCSNDVDDDGDRLTDCADPECYSEPACCAAGQQIPELTGSWSAVFGTTAVETVGGRVRFRTNLTAPAACAAADPGFGMVMPLGVAVALAQPMTFAWRRSAWSANDELSVELDVNALRAVRNGVPLMWSNGSQMSTTPPVSATDRLEWRLHPGLDRDRISVELTLIPMSSPPWTASTFVLREDLAPCGAGAGLVFVSRSGATTRSDWSTTDGPVTTRLACTTPETFEPVSTGSLATLASLLASVPVTEPGSAGDPAIDLAGGWVTVDRTTVDRDRERYMPLAYDVVEARFDATRCGLGIGDAGSGGGPLDAGALDAGLDGGGVTTLASCWGAPTSRGGMMPATVGRDPDYAGARTLAPDLAIDVSPTSTSPVTSLYSEIGFISTYATLRRASAVAGGGLRTVVGERGGRLWGGRAEGALTTPRELEFLESSPTPILSRTHPVLVNDRVGLRLWVLATDARAQRGIHFYSSAAPSGDGGVLDAGATLPAFVAYVGNPILTATHPALACASDATCEIESFDVDRLDGATVVFVVAIAERRAGMPTTRRFVVLRQPLPDM